VYGAQASGKSRLKAVSYDITFKSIQFSDLQSRTEDDKVFQILGRAKTRKAREPKLTLWCGTDSHKVAEECIELVGL